MTNSFVFVRRSGASVADDTPTPGALRTRRLSLTVRTTSSTLTAAGRAPVTMNHERQRRIRGRISSVTVPLRKWQRSSSK